ncbi:DoxX family protein [Catellatospora sp. KI3]|uniref:DoxX family protein n=1 Tax=Catellatospora sp. KI3 TaxID=3041620 RepID=UPI002482D9F4|nr:DoxX family protein [Catellatospora sp. KI3]MDI1464052.1 DoxX family protein [Catellatospora sp. KI3]
MAPLIALVAGTVLLRLLGLSGVDALDAWQPALRGGLALMFVTTGVVHFIPSWRRDMIAMVPSRLPRPDLLVTVTGVLELAGAAGLLVPRTAPLAAAGLALLMAAMFPANVSAARRGLSLGGKPVTPLPQRTVLQVLFIAAAVAAAV